jgi:hypothetical protein
VKQGQHVIDAWWHTRAGRIVQVLKTRLRVRWSDGQVWTYDKPHQQFLRRVTTRQPRKEATMKEQDNQTVTVDATEKGYILKVQFGVVLPFKARDEDHAMEVAKQIAKKFDDLVNQFDPKPEMVHVLGGDVMTAEDFEQAKAHARQQAEALKQLLGAVKQAADNLGMDVQLPQLDESETEQPADQPSEDSGAAVVDAIEPSAGATLVPGSRTLN